MRIPVFYDAMLCRWGGSVFRRFEGTCYVYFQGSKYPRKPSRVNKHQKNSSVTTLPFNMKEILSFATSELTDPEHGVMFQKVV
jgi:hypothetical protein